jgi:hypothetical protein
MAKISYWIVMEPDRTYKVEVMAGGVHQQSHGGFRSDAEADEWVQAQQSAGGGMDTWERQSDFPDR